MTKTPAARVGVGVIPVVGVGGGRVGGIGVGGMGVAVLATVATTVLEAGVGETAPVVAVAVGGVAAVAVAVGGTAVVGTAVAASVDVGGTLVGAIVADVKAPKDTELGGGGITGVLVGAGVDEHAVTMLTSNSTKLRTRALRIVVLHNFPSNYRGSSQNNKNRPED